MSKAPLVMCLVGLASGTALATTTIVKKPDLGGYWATLGLPPNDTPVYADSFIAPANDITPTKLGTWLDDLGTVGATVRFEIWGGTANTGPDYNQVLATTGSVGPFATSGLNFFEFPCTGNNLTPGQLYWFVATCVGEQGSGFYGAGGHTQNSQYNDNGTFWYSNDPAGQNFDGQKLTPEMSFSVTLTPAPGSAAVLGLGVLAILRRRR